MAGFEQWWRDRIGDVLPLGHILREYLHDRWFRIHSLPESKRWPTQETEYDALIRLVADDEAPRLLFAGVARATIYAPYDGGADLFFSSPTAVEVAKSEFRPWLSAREDGL